jgi:hypothetical protein
MAVVVGRRLISVWIHHLVHRPILLQVARDPDLGPFCVHGAPSEGLWLVRLATFARQSEFSVHGWRR